MDCKNKLVVLTTEWLLWLQTSYREMVVMIGLFLVIETNCIKQPERQFPSYPTTTTCWQPSEHLRKSPACIRNKNVPYYNFEAHL